MIGQIANAAAFGFGANAGRDVYRNVKKGGVFVFLLIGIFLTGFGYRELVRGHDRGFFGTLFLTLLGSVFMIIAGSVLMFPFGMIASGFLAGQGAPKHEELALTVPIILVAHFASAVVGLGWGLAKRRVWQRARSVAAHNIKFLRDEGFNDLGVGDDVIEDPDGNRLRLHDQNDNAIVFVAIGRRNVRASIRLDPIGRMTEYTGLVALA